MNNEDLHKACDETLQPIYDYFKTSSELKADEYTTDLMNKMTQAVKACIRFNNTLNEAIKDKLVVLDQQGVNLLNTFYSYYDSLPRSEVEVTESTGEVLMEVYTGIIQSMTPIALFIVSKFED